MTRDRIESIAHALGVAPRDVDHVYRGNGHGAARGVVDLVREARGDLLPSIGDVGQPEWSRGAFIGHYDDGTLRGYDLIVQTDPDDYGPCPTLHRGRPCWNRYRGVTTFVSEASGAGDTSCPCGCEQKRVECYFCGRPAGRVRSASKGGGKMRDACDGNVGAGALTARGECADEQDERERDARRHHR